MCGILIPMPAKGFRYDVQARFWAKVDKTTACWVWLGSKNSNGYGHLRIDGRLVKAHVFSYGVVPNGLELDHLCRNRLCVNPAHLEAVTHAENCQRRTRLLTHCKYGHEFNVENTYLYRTGRVCRTCVRNRGREYQRNVRSFRCSESDVSSRANPNGGV